MKVKDFLERMSNGDNFGEREPSAEHIRMRNKSRNEVDDVPDELSDAVEEHPIRTARIRKG
jgi:hypothetical protein